ncbi:MAG: hypothetical protein AAGG51_18730 [Cyanobacteria bacterium P01_G01_bin.54]
MTDENTRLKNFFGTSAIAIPIGALVIFLGMSISTGDVTQAATLVLVSIVCTLGISLLIWIPLCWLAGMLVLGIFAGTVKLIGLNAAQRSAEKVLQPAITNRATIQQQSLANYIRKAQAKGFSESQIQSRLRQEGWSAEEIEGAQAVVGHFS